MLTNSRGLTIDLTRDSPRATNQYYSAPDTAIADMMALIGGFQGGTWVVPDELTDIPGLYCTSVTSEWLLGTDPVDMAADGFQTVKIIAEYGVLPFDPTATGAGSGGMGIGLYSIAYDEACESIALPATSGVLTYSGSASSAVASQPLQEDSTTPQLLIPNMTITCHCDFTPDTNPTTVATALAAPVSSTTVTIGGVSFTAGTLMLLGVSGENCRSAAGDLGASRTIKLAQRNESWNKIYCPITGVFEPILNGAGGTLYPTSDLNLVFL